MDNNTPLGYTYLTVADLNRTLAFYQKDLGLQLIRQSDLTAALGVDEIELLKITEVSGARSPGRSTGLYHFALRLPARIDLARFTKHLIENQIPVQGVADHHVSEAIYLPDSEGNGIEVYCDRPKESWYDGGGELVLTTDPLDLNSLLAELPSQDANWQGLPSGTQLGHIHLFVADLEATAHFYRDLLGMDLITEYGGSALFFSWNGYHHHIGANTWNGAGAPTPPPGSTGLRYFTLELEPDRVDEICARLETTDVEFVRDQHGVFVRDPAGNGLLLRSKDGSAQ